MTLQPSHIVATINPKGNNFAMGAKTNAAADLKLTDSPGYICQQLAAFFAIEFKKYGSSSIFLTGSFLIHSTMHHLICILSLRDVKSCGKSLIVIPGVKAR